MRTEKDGNRTADIKQAAERLVAQSPTKTRSVDLARRLARRFDLSSGQVRCVIKDLVGEGRLAYTYEYGCSFLEISYRRPVQVSPRILLAPPEFDLDPSDERIIVRVASGAAFGCGRHPTTRLALRGIDRSLCTVDGGRRSGDGSVLDIGTGTGVLVIAAVKLGMAKGVGIDIDPVSRAEARENVRRNHLAHVIRISDLSVERVGAGRPFTMITANLRTPSLMRLAATIAGALKTGGRAVLSGIETDEVEDVLTAYRRCNMHLQWQATEKNWAAVVLTRVRTPVTAASTSI
jgi:ribosomal protein L11 methylase PrmA